MKIANATLLLAVVLWNEPSKSVHAFTPGRNVVGRSNSFSSTSSALKAGRASLPPLPPPPPAVESIQDANPIADLFKSLQETLGQVSIPTDVKDLNVLKGFVLDLNDLPITSDMMESIRSLRDQINALDTRILAELNGVASDFQSQMVKEYPTIMGPIFEKLSLLMGPLLLSPTASILVSSVLSYLAVNALLSWGQPPPPSQPYPLNKYDPIAARAYFDRRLPLVLARGLEVFAQSLQFGLGLLKDKLDDKISENEMQRGRELATLLTKLGPTYIKVGQSLSIRTDLLSPAYVRGLETLQDQVPAFDTQIARQTLESEWGQPVENIIEELPAKPIAAASLGQVYKVKLKGSGQEVAVKVQRPNINEQIALDMHLLREVAPVLKRTFNLNSDTVGTVDAWGRGFVDELDYIQEAKNAAFFSEKIMTTPLKDVVLAPTVIEELTTPQVLVSEWIDGQRLDESAATDVTVLCSIAMNTYLTMLLELGLLHCDPHPGNLLRTPEGKLCILDWGMVTRLEGDLQLTLIEHMAHLTSADYDEIPRDLLLLGFIPQNKADLIEDSGVVELLAEIYGAWTSGGGAAAINVNDVIVKLQDLTAEKGNLFQVPPYFAYIAKSFSVLEGIGLSNDAKYSIINECLPYVSKRLLTDKEKCGPALSTFIFGPRKNDADRIVDYDRVEQLIEGFGDYTTSASGALLGKENVTRVEMLDQSADQILDLVFSEEETPLQEIILDQTAKIVASSSRTLISQLRERSGVLPSGRTLLGAVIDPLGVFRTSPLVRPNGLDERNVETMLKLIELAGKQAEANKNPMFDLSTISREEVMALSSILVRKFWERRKGVLQTGNRFVRRSFQLMAEQLERGERDSRLLPSRETSSQQHSEIKENLDKSIDVTREPAPAPTKRLEEARRLLNGFEDQENADAVVPQPASYSRTFQVRTR